MAQKRQRKAMQPEELAQVMEEEESTDESSLDDDFDQSSDEEVNFSLTEDSEQSEESDHEPDAQPKGDWRHASAVPSAGLAYSLFHAGLFGQRHCVLPPTRPPERITKPVLIGPSSLPRPAPQPLRERESTHTLFPTSPCHRHD
ncbi:UNVERIFIED_CONTAM: hypothetical protein FKN15_028768 [Acipenser sinensis]